MSKCNIEVEGFVGNYKDIVFVFKWNFIWLKGVEIGEVYNVMCIMKRVFCVLG